MRNIFRIGLVLFAFFAADIMAQVEPRPFAFGGLQGRVVDVATGKPIDGAVVVARWDWERYYPGGYHSSPSLQYEGEALKILEVVSAADGAYALPAWGPIVRGMGQAEGRMMAFKSGYEPVELSLGEMRETTISLRRPAGTAEEFAARIAEWQSGHAPMVLAPGAIAPTRRLPPGLRWTNPDDNWQQMPRMILALHREKARLGDAGRFALGANLLHGRAGEGKLFLPGMDELAFKLHGAEPAVVNVTWQMRSEDGRTVRRFVQQKGARAQSQSGFYVSPWRFPQPGPKGWAPDVESAPLVRVYAANYRGSADIRWPEAGATIGLEPLPETREGRLEELRRWRRDIDQELGKGDREEAFAGQAPLIWLLVKECRRLTLDARAGICFDDDSSEARSVPRRPVALERNEDTLGGTDMGYKQANTPSRIEGMTVKPAEIAKGDKKPVSGFTIGPAGK